MKKRLLGMLVVPPPYVSYWGFDAGEVCKHGIIQDLTFLPGINGRLICDLQYHRDISEYGYISQVAQVS